MPSKGRPTGSNYEQQVAAYFALEEPRPSVSAWCKQHGFSRQTFWNVRQKFITAQFSQGRAPAPEPAPFVPQKLDTVILPDGEKPRPRASSNDGLLTFEEAIKLLSDRARSTGDIRAIESIIEHLKALGTTAGPRAPMSQEERIARVTTILESCNISEAQEAFRRAFPTITSVA